MRFRSRRRINPVTGSVIAAIIGLAFIGLGVFLLNNSLKLVQNGIKTEATVIDYRRDTSGNNVTYKPVVEFKLTSGETIQSIDDLGSSNRQFTKGQKVQIIYMEDDPDNFVINSFFRVYGFPCIFIVAGGLALILITGNLIKQSRAKSRSETDYQ
ncbi:MAG: hypothetical protein BWY11_01294 [Firmicutes bacterium ADurb.Bin182]|nr:MAG: hypothetical protein BWY11_01294 [Firmicutes bacterium ADurb.Bin182]